MIFPSSAAPLPFVTRAKINKRYSRGRDKVRIFVSPGLLTRFSYRFLFHVYFFFLVLGVLLALSVARCEFEKDMLMIGLQAHFLLLS